MRAYFDTEYARISKKKISLASIGIIRDDGQQLYFISASSTYNPEDWWFKKNVRRHLKGPRHSLREIASAVQEFLIPVHELVTRDGIHDYALLQDLTGPFWFKPTDIQDLWRSRGKPQLPKRPKKHRHHALEDAEFYKSLYHLVA
jgi:hypothetical protein